MGGARFDTRGDNAGMASDPLNHLLTLHGLLVMLGLLIYVGASRARHQRRHPSAAIAWVVLLVLLPYVALPLYLLFGNRKVVRAKASRQTRVLPSAMGLGTSPAMRFEQLALAMGLPPAAPYQGLGVHADGQRARQSLTALIGQARHHLDVCTFLLGGDVLGRELAELLMHKAAEGVRVRLLIDGIGVYLGGRPGLKRLSAAGVQVALFVSPWRSGLQGRTNLRNHRKMVIADGQQLWCGGRNLAAEYFEGDPHSAHPKVPWIDLTFELSGELAQQAQARFDQDWAFATRSRTPPASPVHHAAATSAAAGKPLAQLIASGPDQVDDTVYTLLVSSCFNAQQRILAVTPYFVPDATLLMALTLAARRGIAVDLVLPRQSNHRLADLARHAALRDMSAAGARVWLLDGMIHAKGVVIDDELAMVGSANLDERSLFLNYELMVAFYQPDDVERFASWIEANRAGASIYQAHPPSLAREIGEGLIRWLAFQL
jgi:cardiolipin synthase